MNAETFNNIIEERITGIRETLVRKGKEYSSETDRLHNFKRAGKVLQCSPEKALLGFLTKHLVSIFDMIDEADTKIHSLEMINEKCMDSINYFILLEALFKERYYEACYTDFLNKQKECTL